MRAPWLPVALVCLTVACSSKSPAPEAAEQPAEAVAAPAAPATSEPEPAPVVEQPATPEPAASPAPEPAPEPPAPVVVLPSGELGTLQNPIPAKTEWTKLRGVSDMFSFHIVPRGVIGGCSKSDNDCELTAEGKVVATRYDGIEPDARGLMGWWPDNMWHVEMTADSIDVGDEPMGLDIMTALQWNGKKWTKFERKVRSSADAGNDFMGELAGRASWSGGLIVCHTIEGRAYNSLAPDTTLASFDANTPFGISQTATGKLIPFVRRDGQVQAIAPCLGSDCSSNPSYAIRLGNDDEISLQVDVSRGGDSMSYLFYKPRAEPPVEALLHYDGGEQWTETRIEDVPGSNGESMVEGMWGDPNGGLWVNIVEGQLLHRGADNRWYVIESPAGKFDSYAMRVEPSEFLAMVETDEGGAAVYATRGPVVPIAVPAEGAAAEGAAAEGAAAEGAAAEGAAPAEAAPVEAAPEAEAAPVEPTPAGPTPAED